MAACRRVARPSRLRGDERPGLWRGRRQGRTLLGAGQLVSRRRDADAVHHLDLRPAEPGAADVPEGHAARGSDRGLAPLRSGAAHASGRLGQGALAPADPGHPQERQRPEGHLCRSHAGRDRRHDAAARAGVRCVAQGRAVARRHGAERARPLVHVVVRRVGRAEPRDVQSRAPHRESADATISSGP